MLPGFSGIAGGIGKTYAVDFQTGYATSADQTTYSFVANFGVAAEDREILVLWAACVSSSRTVSSGSIGGVSHTVVSSSFRSGTVDMNFYVTRALVPTGSSGTVSITLSSTALNMSASAWRVQNVDWAASTIQTALASTTSVGTTWTEVPNSNIVLQAIHDDGGAASWSNATEVYDAAAAGDSGSAAIRQSTTSGGLTIAVSNPSSNPNGMVGIQLKEAA